MESNNLKLGVNVKIQRTDGRIHLANVIKINPDTQCVTVEWTERGEIKGKEIELEDIFVLNPEHFVKKSAEPLKPKNEGEEPMIVDSAEENEGNVIKRTVSCCQRQSKLVPPRKKATCSNTSLVAPKIPVRVAPQRRPSASTLGPVTSSSRLNAGPQDSPRRSVMPAVSSGLTSGNPVLAAGKKKLSCVKAVEKIAKHRHDRRMTQQALREQREQIYDTTTPNWEFDVMIRDFRSTLAYSQLTYADDVADHQICVCVRKRPLNSRELSAKEIDVITIPAKDLLLVHEPKMKVDQTRYLENQQFRFDYAFDEKATNEMVYRFTAKPLVESIFNHGMATCFAYGQTGSGKTHTMGGEFCGKAQQDCSKGIYALAASDVFQQLNTKYRKLNLVASASFFEIYSGKVFDLLNNKAKLRILEDGRQQVQIVDLKETDISSVDDVLGLIQLGSAVRTSGVTSANNHSSRSHAVFQIILRSRSTKKLHGKFSLIDLAGNERGADTFSSDRLTRMEGAEINKSLLALKECIRALGRAGSHLPFRASRLTHVLRDSFIGSNSRTCMIAMISPSMSCCEHTLNTLRYADRVKELGSSGASEAKMTDVEQHISGSSDGVSSSLNNDLAVLQSDADEEVTQEMRNIHEAMHHVQEQEEELVEGHGQLIEQSFGFLENAQKLLKVTEGVDYDVEAYALQLDCLLADRITSLTALKAKVEHFRHQMQDEENMIKSLKTHNRVK